MLRLHGFRFSNYHSLVKVVLLEKGLAFEEVVTYPLADEAYRAKNPTGKFPCLEIEDGTFLGESKVILNYLEVYRTRFLEHESRLTGIRPDRPNRDARRAP